MYHSFAEIGAITNLSKWFIPLVGISSTTYLFPFDKLNLGVVLMKKKIHQTMVER